MRCGKCGGTENLIVHARRFRKRTGDYYTRYYCRECQRNRVLDWYHSRNVYERIENKGWEQTARETNRKLMEKYAH